MRHKLVQRIVEAYDVHAQRGSTDGSGVRGLDGRVGPGSGTARAPSRLVAPAPMIEVEVLGAGARARRAAAERGHGACARAAAAAAGVEDGHLAIEFVDSRADRRS